MKTVYQNIHNSIQQKRKMLAVLIDPDKVFIPDINLIAKKINESSLTHIFVGGSTVEAFKTELVVEKIKQATELPIVIFPGDTDQITDEADALLFLNLISGRNPDYLITKQVEAARILRNSELEVISTSYILIGKGNNSAVEKVTGTSPMNFNDTEAIVNTAVAGELMGHKMIYLEAGSGAKESVTSEIIIAVSQAISIPLIVGGGFSDLLSIKKAYNNGADMVVVGTAFENDYNFFKSTIEEKRLAKKINIK